MEQLNELLKSMIKEALAEVIQQEQQTKRVPEEKETYIYGLHNLARKLGVGYVTVWKMIHEGKIPAYRVGKKFYFRLSEVNKALKHS